MKTKGILIALNFLLFSSFTVLGTLAKASITLQECPNQYVAKIVSVKDETGPMHSLSKKLVKAFPVRTIKGEKVPEIYFKSLKFGNLKFVEGQTYFLSLNQGFLCRAEVMGDEQEVH